jgi:hypothetical protein
MRVWHHIKVVLWSFVGLGRRQHAAELAEEKVNPLIFIGVAFGVVLVFLGTLALIAHSAAT